jgi:hypothetical protein
MPKCSKQNLNSLRQDEVVILVVNVHPTEEVQLHATSIINPCSISPTFVEINRDFRDGIRREIG